tara:strand:- start:1137 stop:1724 length:588 start_codon:yes stop_codon:yes gene_type:complete
MKNIETSYLGSSSRDDFGDFEELFHGVESFMGYLPNAHIAMAERPAILIAFSEFTKAIFQSEGIDIKTKQLIALATSLSSGCKYCQAHTSHGASNAGVSKEKIAQILNYTESEYFDDKERAILDLSFAAGKTPNMASKENIDNLRNYYSKKEIIDIVAVISLFGFLNRWNDTLGTALEDVPSDFVEQKLKPLGWK